MIIPETSKKFGFVTKGLGAHSGRTIMLEELRQLFRSCGPSKNKLEYQDAILIDNVLLKPTQSAREKAYRYLSELYSLDRKFLVFQVLQLLWEQDSEAQPLLALICAIARDPILRSTVDFVAQIPIGSVITALDFSRIIEEQNPSHLSPSTLASSGRNLASSWTQSGHFLGKTGKVRKSINSNPISTTYTLFLAYLCDYRGDGLFSSPWVKLLDAPTHVIYDQAQLLSQQGWLEYRHSGAITEITFRHLMKDQA